MIESLVASLLQGTLDRYIGNLRPADLNLSLWGGDVVLRNLALRVDAVQADWLSFLPPQLQLQRGLVRELRIHIPWSALSSEPLVITATGVELACSGADDPSSRTSHVSSAAPATPSSARLDNPGYFQSYFSAVRNNVRLELRDATLTYSQAGIECALACRSLDLFSVDDSWQPAFVAIEAPSFTMHKVLRASGLSIRLRPGDPHAVGDMCRDAELECRMRVSFASAAALLPSMMLCHVRCDTLDLRMCSAQAAALAEMAQHLSAVFFNTEPVALDMSDVTMRKQHAATAEPSLWGSVWSLVSPAPATAAEPVPSVLSMTAYLGRLSLRLYDNTGTATDHLHVAECVAVESKLELLGAGDRLTVQLDVQSMRADLLDPASATHATTLRIGSSTLDQPDTSFLQHSLFHSGTATPRAIVVPALQITFCDPPQPQLSSSASRARHRAGEHVAGTLFGMTAALGPASVVLRPRPVSALVSFASSVLAGLSFSSTVSISDFVRGVSGGAAVAASSAASDPSHVERFRAHLSVGACYLAVLDDASACTGDAAQPSGADSIDCTLGPACDVMLEEIRALLLSIQGAVLEVSIPLRAETVSIPATAMHPLYQVLSCQLTALSLHCGAVDQSFTPAAVLTTGMALHERWRCIVSDAHVHTLLRRVAVPSKPAVHSAPATQLSCEIPQLKCCIYIDDVRRLFGLLQTWRQLPASADVSCGGGELALTVSLRPITLDVFSTYHDIGGSLRVGACAVDVGSVPVLRTGEDTASHALSVAAQLPVWDQSAAGAVGSVLPVLALQCAPARISLHPWLDAFLDTAAVHVAAALVGRVSGGDGGHAGSAVHVSECWRRISAYPLSFLVDIQSSEALIPVADELHPSTTGSADELNTIALTLPAVHGLRWSGAAPVGELVLPLRVAESPCTPADWECSIGSIRCVHAAQDGTDFVLINSSPVFVRRAGSALAVSADDVSLAVNVASATALRMTLARARRLHERMPRLQPSATSTADHSEHDWLLNVDIASIRAAVHSARTRVTGDAHHMSLTAAAADGLTTTQLRCRRISGDQALLDPQDGVFDWIDPQRPQSPQDGRRT